MASIELMYGRNFPEAGTLMRLSPNGLHKLNNLIPHLEISSIIQRGQDSLDELYAYVPPKESPHKNDPRDALAFVSEDGYPFRVKRSADVFE